MHLLDARQEIELSDAADQQLHTAIAAVALAIAPLGVAGGEVALVVLLGASLARAKDLWPVWLEALRSPLAAAFAGFVIWICLSLIWSPDPAHGIDHLQCMRALLWAPLLYPLIRNSGSRVVLLLALLAGITLLCLTQLWQWGKFQLLHDGPAAIESARFGGLHGEVGKAGMWAGAGVCIGAFLCVSPHLSRGMRTAAAAAMLCCLGGTCACATLRAMGGTAFGLVTAAVVAVALPAAGDRLRRTWVILPVAVALAGIWLGADRRWDDKVDRQVEPARQEPVTARTRPPAARDWYVTLDSLPPRILWWRASWHAFLQHPVIGRGWGATPTIVSEYPGAAEFVAANPRALAQHPSLLRPSQPHSFYLMTLGEFGGIGAMLLATVVALVVRNCVRAARCCAELAGPAAATALWFVAAGGDTVFNAAVFAAGAIFMAFTAPLPRTPIACLPPPVGARNPTSMAA